MYVLLRAMTKRTAHIMQTSNFVTNIMNWFGFSKVYANYIRYEFVHEIHGIHAHTLVVFLFGCTTMKMIGRELPGTEIDDTALMCRVRACLLVCVCESDCAENTHRTTSIDKI